MRHPQDQAKSPLEFADRTSGRSRVVLENFDAGELWHAASLLRDAGYDVVTCEGPERLGQAGCPLLLTGACVAITDADVVVSSILHEDGGPDVLDAIRNRHPQTPMVVVTPQPTARRNAERLEGCHIVSPMLTESRLLEAVEHALATPVGV